MEETTFSTHGVPASSTAQREGETTLTVRTGGPNDALLVPDGIETVVVNTSAERVIIPAGVEVIRLQGAQQQQQQATPAPPVAHHQPPPLGATVAAGERPSYGDMIDELVRAKRSVATDATQTPTLRMNSHPPTMSEKSLSLPSCPPTPPGSRSMATGMSIDQTDFKPAARLPPLARQERTSDIFDDRTLEVDRTRVIQQQPAAGVPNGRTVRYTGTTEQDMRDPLMASRSAKMKHLDSFGWREEFEHGEKEYSRTFPERVGRFCADVLCCWMGL